MGRPTDFVCAFQFLGQQGICAHFFAFPELAMVEWKLNLVKCPCKNLSMFLRILIGMDIKSIY